LEARFAVAGHQGPEQQMCRLFYETQNLT
jgi:hypothetical protein